MNLIDTINQETIAELAKDKAIPTFRAGDTLKVHVKVTEGTRTRTQIFEGVCIGRHNNATGSSFTVRKMSFGEGVERVFPLFSPSIEKIEVVRMGRVRRAKLFYLRGRTGKSARIAEKARKAGVLNIVQPAAPKAPEAEATPKVAAEA